VEQSTNLRYPEVRTRGWIYVRPVPFYFKRYVAWNRSWASMMRCRLLSHVTTLKHDFHIDNIKKVSTNNTENKLCHSHYLHIVRVVISAYSENYRRILGDSEQTGIFFPTENPKGRDSSVGISTRYGLDGPGIESRWGTRYSIHVQTGPGSYPASYTMNTRSLSRL